VFRVDADGTLGQLRLEWTEGASACVVAANRGYPGKYETGAEIEGLDQSDEPRSKSFMRERRCTETAGLLLRADASGLTRAAKPERSLELCYGACER
jgi:phosphoribosylamine--glycine ligase